MTGHSRSRHRSSIHGIALRSGDAVRWLRIEDLVHAPYDMVTSSGVRRPMKLGFKADDIQRVIDLEDTA